MRKKRNKNNVKNKARLSDNELARETVDDIKTIRTKSKGKAQEGRLHKPPKSLTGNNVREKPDGKPSDENRKFKKKTASPTAYRSKAKKNKKRKKR